MGNAHKEATGRRWGGGWVALAAAPLDARGQQDLAGLLDVPSIGQQLVHFNHFLVAHALSHLVVGHLAVAVQIVEHVTREAHDRHEEKEEPATNAAREARAMKRTREMGAYVMSPDMLNGHTSRMKKKDQRSKSGDVTRRAKTAMWRRSQNTLLGSTTTAIERHRYQGAYVAVCNKLCERPRGRATTQRGRERRRRPKFSQ